jgi:hypothetical protein
MTNLERSYRHLKSLPFPVAPEGDALADVVSTMSELTDRLSSLAARAGRGEEVRPEEVPNVGDLVLRLRDLPGIDEDDIDSYTATVNYIEALEDLRQALLGK